MVERLDWMDEVAAIKQLRTLPVADPGREAQLLDAMEQRGLSVSVGVPKSATHAFFTGQITAAKEFQAEWLQQHPRPQSRSLPDLAKTVRPALDRIGVEMLTHLGNLRSVHADATTTVEMARQHLARAGYSQAVIDPSLQGLRAALPQ
jgi:chorismate mutase-like protein